MFANKFSNSRDGYVDSRSSNRDETVQIDFKTFTLRSSSDGRSIWWSERTRNACYMLDFNRDEARWISLTFREYIQLNQAVLSFRRLRGRNAVFTIQRFNNKRGSFIELSKFNKLGKKFTTIVPSGEKAIGWIKLSKSLDKLITGDYHRQFAQKKPIYGKIHPMSGMSQQKKCLEERQSKEGFNPESDVNNKKQVNKKWNEAIIITRGRVTSSWKLIEEVLRKATTSNIKLFPFQADKALWWPSSAEQYTYYINLKKGYFDSRVYLEFERWSTRINTSDSVESCCHSWIWIRGLPWELWSPTNFKIIGDLCGGLLAISSDTLHFRMLGAARIKVKGTEGGFIQTKMSIPFEGRPTEIRIRVETFDSKGYEEYEKQTYAQVVVNGKKILAGWGNNNIYNTLARFGDGDNTQHMGKTNFDDLQLQEKIDAASTKVRGPESWRDNSDVNQGHNSPQESQKNQRVYPNR